MGNRRAPTKVNNAHPKHVWMGVGLGWGWMGCAGSRDDGQHPKILAHVAARCGAVEAADVSAGADSARVGGGPVGAGRGRRTRSCVC